MFLVSTVLAYEQILTYLSLRQFHDLGTWTTGLQTNGRTVRRGIFIRFSDLRGFFPVVLGFLIVFVVQAILDLSIHDRQDLFIC